MSDLEESDPNVVEVKLSVRVYLKDVARFTCWVTGAIICDSPVPTGDVVIDSPK